MASPNKTGAAAMADADRVAEKRTKTAQVNLRIKPTLKSAAEQAAAADCRTLTSLIEKLLVDHIKTSAALHA
jgi:hypothetical protein